LPHFEINVQQRIFLYTHIDLLEEEKNVEPYFVIFDPFWAQKNSFPGRKT
jgi:hypothetical protein